MFVDIQEGHQVNFIFPSAPVDVRTPSVSPPRKSVGSKAHSYRSLRQEETTPLLVRLSGVKSGLEETRDKEKIPLFVPSEIIKPNAGRLTIPERQSSRRSPDAALRIGDAAQDGQSSGQENCSREALSEASDWSTTVQFEATKQELFQPKSEVSLAPASALAVKQESRLEGKELQAQQLNAQERVTPSGPDEAESIAGGLSNASHRIHRGMRVFQNCSAYLQHVKKHFWRSPNANANDT